MDMNKQELEKQHDALVEQLKEKCGQSGAKTIVGWSIRDCLDNLTTEPLMRKILELREKIK